MREIKFRAWFEGHMYEIAKLDFWGDPEQATCDMVRISLTEDGYTEECEVYLCEVELLQYTGLHDKNGVEIYEGDIVLTDEAGWVGHVVYEHDCFMVIDGKGGFSSCCNWEAFEVIGNIHDKEG